MILANGQFYQVNSFDLGFINIAPADLLIEIKQVDLQKNELIISILPLPGQEVSESIAALAKWFTNTYPMLKPEDCLLRNPSAFSKLVFCGLVTPHHPATSAMFPSLLTQIQQNTPWPTLSGAHPHKTEG